MSPARHRRTKISSISPPGCGSHDPAHSLFRFRTFAMVITPHVMPASQPLFSRLLLVITTPQARGYTSAARHTKELCLSHLRPSQQQGTLTPSTEHAHR